MGGSQSTLSNVPFWKDRRAASNVGLFLSGSIPRVAQQFKTYVGGTSASQISRTILYYTILYYTILHYTILYHTMLHYTTLYYNILYYTIIYCTVLYYTILYYTVLY